MWRALIWWWQTCVAYWSVQNPREKRQAELFWSSWVSTDWFKWVKNGGEQRYQNHKMVNCDIQITQVAIVLINVCCVKYRSAAIQRKWKLWRESVDRLSASQIVRPIFTFFLTIDQCWVTLLLNRTHYVTRLPPLENILLRHCNVYWEKRSSTLELPKFTIKAPCDSLCTWVILSRQCVGCYMYLWMYWRHHHVVAFSTAHDRSLCNLIIGMTDQ